MSHDPSPKWEGFFSKAAGIERLVITGAPGAGKTTFAQTLSSTLDLPVISDDHHVMLRDWATRSEDEQVVLRNRAVSADRWVLDGVDLALNGDALDRAEFVIWLDVPIGTRLSRVVGRTYDQLGTTRAEHPEGNPERFNLQKLRFLVGMALRSSMVRQRIAARIRRHKIPFVRLRGVAQIDRFSDEFQRRMSSKN